MIAQVCEAGTSRWHDGVCAAGWMAWPPRRGAAGGPVGGPGGILVIRLGPPMLIRVIAAGDLPLLVIATDLVMLVLTGTAGKDKAEG